jgi:biotin synthase
LAEYLFERARAIRHAIYGKDVYIRGLIEVSAIAKTIAYIAGYEEAIKTLKDTD